MASGAPSSAEVREVPGAQHGRGGRLAERGRVDVALTRRRGARRADALHHAVAAQAHACRLARPQRRQPARCLRGDPGVEPVRREVQHAGGQPREHGGGDGEQLAQRPVHLHQLGELGGRGRARGAVGGPHRVDVLGERLARGGDAVQRRGEARPRRRRRAGGQARLVALARLGQPAGADDAQRGRRVFAQQRVAQEREQQRVGAARRRAGAHGVEAVVDEPVHVALGRRDRHGLRRRVGGQRAGETGELPVEHGAGERRDERQAERPDRRQGLQEAEERADVGGRARHAASGVVDRHRAHGHAAGQHRGEVHAGRDARHPVQRGAPGGREAGEQRHHQRVEVGRVEQPPLRERGRGQHAVRLAADPQDGQRAAGRHVGQEVPAGGGHSVVGDHAEQLVERVAPRHRPQRRRIRRSSAAAMPPAPAAWLSGSVAIPSARASSVPSERRGGERGAALVAQAHGRVVAGGRPGRPHALGVVGRRAGRRERQPVGVVMGVEQRGERAARPRRRRRWRGRRARGAGQGRRRTPRRAGCAAPCRARRRGRSPRATARQARAAPPGRPPRRRWDRGRAPACPRSGARARRTGARRRGSRARSSGRAARSSAPRASTPRRAGARRRGRGAGDPGRPRRPERPASARQASRVAGAVTPLAFSRSRYAFPHASSSAVSSGSCVSTCSVSGYTRTSRSLPSKRVSSRTGSSASGRSAASSATRSSGLSPATSSPRRRSTSAGAAPAIPASAAPISESHCCQAVATFVRCVAMFAVSVPGQRLDHRLAGLGVGELLLGRGELLLGAGELRLGRLELGVGGGERRVEHRRRGVRRCRLLAARRAAASCALLNAAAARADLGRRRVHRAGAHPARRARGPTGTARPARRCRRWPPPPGRAQPAQWSESSDWLAATTRAWPSATACWSAAMRPGSCTRSARRARDRPWRRPAGRPA